MRRDMKNDGAAGRAAWPAMERPWPVDEKRDEDLIGSRPRSSLDCAKSESAPVLPQGFCNKKVVRVGISIAVVRRSTVVMTETDDVREIDDAHLGSHTRKHTYIHTYIHQMMT